MGFSKITYTAAAALLTQCIADSGLQYVPIPPTSTTQILPTLMPVHNDATPLQKPNESLVYQPTLDLKASTLVNGKGTSNFAATPTVVPTGVQETLANTTGFPANQEGIDESIQMPNVTTSNFLPQVPVPLAPPLFSSTLPIINYYEQPYALPVHNNPEPVQIPTQPPNVIHTSPCKFGTSTIFDSKLYNGIKTLPLLCDHSTRIRMIVVGQWGSSLDNPSAKAVQASIKNEVAVSSAINRSLKGIDFVVSIAPNFGGSGIRSVNDPILTKEWIEAYGIGTDMNVPWVNIIGQDDRKGDPLAQVRFAQINGNWVMPALSYDIDASMGDDSRVKLIFIDTTNKDDSTLEWLGDVVKAKGYKLMIAFGAHDIHAKAQDTKDHWLRKMDRILNRWNSSVKAYISAEEQDLEFLQKGFFRRLDYLISGGGGNLRNGKQRNKHTSAHVKYAVDSYGYLTLDLDVAEKRLEVTFHCIGDFGEQIQTKTIVRKY